MRDIYNLKSAPRRASPTFLVTVAVLLMLAVIKVLGQMPGQLLLTVGVIFLACSALFWGACLSKGAREQGSSEQGCGGAGGQGRNALRDFSPAPLLPCSPAPLLPCCFFGC